LAHEITVLHVASRHTFGAPRIHAEMTRLGRHVNRKRVERVMRERSIAGVTRRSRRSLTRPEKRAVPAPDLIGRDFTAPVPGVKLVGDVTFIPTEQGWLYLTTWLDLATREVVGYAMADHHRASLVVDALTMAAGCRSVNRPVGDTASQPRSARRLARDRTPSIFAGTNSSPSPDAIFFAIAPSPFSGPDSTSSTIRRYSDARA
jgi:transposase InsO family protein